MILSVVTRAVSALVICLVVVAVGLSAIYAIRQLADEPGSAAPAPSNLATADDWLDAYGGDLAVYQRIMARHDCDALLSEYDQATEVNELVQPGTGPYRHSAGYLRLAAERLRVLNCF